MMVPVDGKWTCKRCGKAKSSRGQEEKIITAIKEDQGMLLIDEKTDTVPKTKARCEKCGHNEAYWVLRQTRAADEPETRIYRCVKCSHSWREY